MVDITSAELQSLQAIVRRTTEDSCVVDRARLVLAYLSTGCLAAVALAFGTTPKRVRRWVDRWQHLRSVDSLRDLARTGRPPRFGLIETSKVLSLVSESPSAYGLVTSSWTQELVVEVLAQEGVRLSRSTVQRILSRQEVDIRTVRYWLFPRKDQPEFVQRRDAICTLYLGMHDLPEDELVVCFDAKPGIQLLRDPRPNVGSGVRSRRPRRMEFEYVRMGTRSVVAAVAPATGEVLHWDLFHKARRFDSKETVGFLEELRVKLAARGIRKIHLVLDNGTTHRSNVTKKYFSDHTDTCGIYLTPVHASWLNLCETFFSVFARRYLRHRRYTSPGEFDASMPLWVEDHNRRCRPLRWTYAPHQRAA